jgi:hypothetical protein
MEALDKMERFQPIGHAILNGSGIIQVSTLKTRIRRPATTKYQSLIQFLLECPFVFMFMKFGVFLWQYNINYLLQANYDI